VSVKATNDAGTLSASAKLIVNTLPEADLSLEPVELAQAASVLQKPAPEPGAIFPSYENIFYCVYFQVLYCVNWIHFVFRKRYCTAVHREVAGNGRCYILLYKCNV
jgi:hypothetical protein